MGEAGIHPSASLNCEPAESEGGLFGGNSSWREPIWFPINYLLIESLQKFNHCCADYVTGINLFVDGGLTLYPGFEAGG
jgi:hypothetical protein